MIVDLSRQKRKTKKKKEEKKNMSYAITIIKEQVDGYKCLSVYLDKTMKPSIRRDRTD